MNPYFNYLNQKGSQEDDYSDYYSDEEQMNPKGPLRIHIGCSSEGDEILVKLFDTLNYPGSSFLMINHSNLGISNNTLDDLKLARNVSSMWDMLIRGLNHKIDMRSMNDTRFISNLNNIPNYNIPNYSHGKYGEISDIMGGIPELSLYQFANLANYAQNYSVFVTGYLDNLIHLDYKKIDNIRIFGNNMNDMHDMNNTIRKISEINNVTIFERGMSECTFTNFKEFTDFVGLPDHFELYNILNEYYQDQSVDLSKLCMLFADNMFILEKEDNINYVTGFNSDPKELIKDLFQTYIQKINTIHQEMENFNKRFDNVKVDESSEPVQNNQPINQVQPIPPIQVRGRQQVQTRGRQSVVNSSYGSQRMNNSNANHTSNMNYQSHVNNRSFGNPIVPRNHPKF